MSKVPIVVSHAWLADQISKGAKNITILDATLPSPGSAQRSEALKDCHAKHIPGALFFDIDATCPENSPYTHTLGTPEKFAEYVGGSLGITNDTHVVIYDNYDKVGVFTAPRAWWMFRIFGHKNISILEGGLKHWIAEGHEVTAEVPQVQAAQYMVTFYPHLLVKFDEMFTNVKEQKFQVVDARGKGLFDGTVHGPIPAVDPGHIVNSISVPFTNIFQSDKRLFKSAEDMKNMFEENGIDLSKPLVSTCCAALSACCLSLAAHLAGKPDVPVFDGSWEEFYLRCKDKHPEYIVTAKKE